MLVFILEDKMGGNELKQSYEFLSNLKEGKAFLITKKDQKVNVMQIGWGYIGYMWFKPSMIVAVRHSRHTYEILNESEEFTICIPKRDQFEEELKICGSNSGRDIDKISKCGFELLSGTSVKVPSIKDCQYTYECKVMYKQSLDSELLNKQLMDKSYKNNDYHVMIYGEIISAY